MKSKIAGVFLGFFLVMSNSVYAAEFYLSGNISNITSHAGGLMLMLDSGVPDDCIGAPYGWMLIPESNTTMIATALMTYSLGKGATVYVNPYPGSGRCVINQFDPH